MLRRAWLFVAVPWAALIFWLGAREDMLDQPHIWIVALLLIALPRLLALAGRYVVTGSPRPPRVRRYRRP